MKPTTAIPLESGTFLASRLARGACIRCLGGELLVTLEGVNEDFHLVPGQALRLPRRGKAVVEALVPATMRIE